jgi:hypothetical protein
MTDQAGRRLKVVLTEEEIDRLHTALGTFLQDYPNYWRDEAWERADKLQEKLAYLVYGSGPMP